MRHKALVSLDERYFNKKAGGQSEPIHFSVHTFLQVDCMHQGQYDFFMLFIQCTISFIIFLIIYNKIRLGDYNRLHFTILYLTDASSGHEVLIL